MPFFGALLDLCVRTNLHEHLQSNTQLAPLGADDLHAVLSQLCKKYCSIVALRKPAHARLEQNQAVKKKFFILAGDMFTQAHNLALKEGDPHKHSFAKLCYVEAIKADPMDFYPFKLANHHMKCANQYTDAALLLRQGIAAQHGRIPEMYQELCRNLCILGRAEEAASVAEEGFRSCGDACDRLYWQIYLMRLNYSERDRDEISRLHLQWGQSVEDAVGPVERPIPEDRDPGRVLRVGYLSGDVWNHTLGDCMEGLFRAHNRDTFHISVYQANTSNAHVEELSPLTDSWVQVAGLSAQEIASRVRDDKIDLLVEISGLTLLHRTLLEVMAHRPAPIQVNWLGYPNTSGLKCMDYRITDNICDPIDSTQIYTEELVRLPTCFICVPKPEEMKIPVAVAPPATRNGYITFGTFNNLAKHSNSCQKVWGRVLAEVSNSRFMAKGLAFTQEAARQSWADGFAQNAVDKSATDFNFKSMSKFKGRLLLKPATHSYFDHCRLYDDMDIMLDSWPYSGTVTSVEALLMGVPIVTLHRRGDTAIHANNVTASILKQVGLEDLVASTEDEFVQIAVRLSQDHGRLQELRRTLRPKCIETISAPTAETFGMELEAEYRKMWSRLLDECCQ